MCVLIRGVYSEEVSQMEPKTLIQLLNFSRNLIQDGEIKFLLYQQYPTHPDEVGTTQRRLINNWEKQLRENPPKSKNPEALQKDILKYIEEEKRYGRFRGSEKDYIFLESNLVFQIFSSKEQFGTQRSYRLEDVYIFEDYPSLEYLRFFNGGNLRHFFFNGSQTLIREAPNQFSNDRIIGFLEKQKYFNSEVLMAAHQAPSWAIDETQAKVHLSEVDTPNVPIYVIIDYNPDAKMKVKIYVRIENKIPEVFKEEFYYKSSSPHANTEGYWLRLVRTYSNFEQVETLNIAIPKVREEKEFRGADRFMRRHTVITIKEMDFNLGLPINFFDWNVSELTDDEGRRKIIDDVEKKDPDKEATE